MTATNWVSEYFFLVAFSRRLWFVVVLDSEQGGSRVTAEPAASRAPAGEAGFRLLAEHLPDLMLLAFDPQPEIWAATGAALRGECRRLVTVGRLDPPGCGRSTSCPCPTSAGP